MLAVRVEVIKWIEDAQPGMVACRLFDVWGNQHTFVEKLPVVTTAWLDSNSTYPQPGWIACEVVQQRLDDSGRDIITITTGQPRTVTLILGVTQFEVLSEQLADI